MAYASRFGIWFFAVAFTLVAPSGVRAYLNNGRWSSTATDPVTDPLGRPVTLTWSIVPDGTMISHLSKPSNLVSVFDGLFPDSAGVPLVEKFWFALVKQCFDRWSEVSGVTYVYEPSDDGTLHGAAAGRIGTRGDIRLGGALIDGASSTNNTLATASLIPIADITIDTSDTSYFGVQGTFAPYINLRTTLMHEIGHTLGLGHSSSNNATFLMEGVLPAQITFDGPQIDDIRGAQYLYGDVYEKAYGGAGNETFATATFLGPMGPGHNVSIGKSADPDTVVLAHERDFLSISNSNDVDIFSFSVNQPASVDIVLAPAGPTYHEQTTIDSLSQTDLTLELYAGGTGTSQLLESVDLTGIGQAESILNFNLHSSGTYYVRISGNRDALQLYQLLIDVNSPFLPGDFNIDGRVDSADFTTWRDHLGETTESAISNRGDGLNGVDEADLALWRTHFGDTIEFGTAATQSVPEPAQMINLMWLVLLFAAQCRQPNWKSRKILPRTHYSSNS